MTTLERAEQAAEHLKKIHEDFRFSDDMRNAARLGEQAIRACIAAEETHPHLSDILADRNAALAKFPEHLK